MAIDDRLTGMIRVLRLRAAGHPCPWTGEGDFRRMRAAERSGNTVAVADAVSKPLNCTTTSSIRIKITCPNLRT
jgi:hypothetical protein